MNIKSLFVVEEEDKNKQHSNEQKIEVTSSEKTLGIIAHVSTFLGFIFPFGNILGPVVIYYLKKDESVFIKENARAAVNFQISFTIYILIAMICYSFIVFYLIIEAPLMFYGMVVGPFLFFYLIEFVLVAFAIRSASGGKIHRYPLTINFLRDH